MSRSKVRVRDKSPSLDSGFHFPLQFRHRKRSTSPGASNLEFERTKRILLRYLPRKPSTVVDVGGGPGRYSFWLAKKGYTVHLVDIMPLQIRQAREFQRKSGTGLASISVGDARQLDFPDRSANVVLLFGPMYHLVREDERLRALSEARRVLKPGGLLFAAAISRFTSALDGSLRGYIRDPQFMKIIKQDLETGQHRNLSNNPRYFTTAFFHHPDQIGSELNHAGFGSAKVYGVTGFAWLLSRFNEIWKNSHLKERLMTIMDMMELEPTLLGASDHLLAFAKK